MKNVLHNSKTFVKRNASTILACAGGAGVVVTSVMAVKATPKAQRLLAQAKEEKGDDLSRLEKVTVAGPAYIPSVIMGTATIAAIFGANALNQRQQAALMSAYALLDNSYKEYRNKVKDLQGEEVDNQVRDEITKDNYDKDSVHELAGQELFYDEFSKRYFKSTKYAVQHAAYEINRDLIMRDYATLNEYYAYLGLPEIEGGDEVGWSTAMNFDYYWQLWIDFGCNKVILEDGTECTRIYMFQEPDVNYEDYC